MYICNRLQLTETFNNKNTTTKTNRIMELKYDVYTINNATGSGEERNYVKVLQHEPMTARQLQEKIQQRCSLTKGDVAAVLSELHDILVEEFQMGCRFYIPEIGYFSMSASLEMPEDKPDKKITGKEVRITGINFRPEAGLLQEVQRGVSFVRSRYSRRSTQYTEEKLLAKIKEYLQDNRYITCRELRILFGLTQYTAQKWLNHFCEQGVMVKDGTARSPLFFLEACDRPDSS